MHDHVISLSPPPPRHADIQSHHQQSDVKYSIPCSLGHETVGRQIVRETQPSYQDDGLILLTRNKRSFANNSLRCQPLPYEVVCRIFLECNRVDEWAPTTVSHVCHSWRQIALSHGELWTRIELGRREAGLHRASVWAERAGTFPVNIVIWYSEHTDHRDMISWLQDRTNRIRSVTILHMDQKSENPLLPSFPPLERMESLHILGLEDIDLDIRWIAKVFNGSPSLSSLSLSGVGGLYFHESLINAGRLTHLSLGALSHIDYAFPLRVDAVLDVISTCTGLLSLECYALGEEDDCDPPVVFLPLLSSLTIGDGPETCLVLKYLHAPQLRSLRLVHGRVLNEKAEEVEMPDMSLNWNDYVNVFVDCVRVLYEKCTPRITKVIWDRAVVDVGVLDLCALYLRGMEELECYGPITAGGVPRFLAMTGESTSYPYPFLRKMTFSKCSFSGQWLEVIQIAIGRQGFSCSPPMEQLIVEDCPGASDTYLSWARAKTRSEKALERGPRVPCVHHSISQSHRQVSKPTRPESNISN